MKITLEFDTPQAADRFMIWWIDGGGEQYLNFDTTSFDIAKGYLRIEGDGTVMKNKCPRQSAFVRHLDELLTSYYESFSDEDSEKAIEEFSDKKDHFINLWCPVLKEYDKE